jgi:hypothetical protein
MRSIHKVVIYFTFLFPMVLTSGTGDLKAMAGNGQKNENQIKLNISIFSGTPKIIEAEKGIDEESLLLIQCAPFTNKMELEINLNALTGPGISGLTVNPFANSENLLGSDSLDNVNWIKDEIVMKVSISESQGNTLPVNGKISFFDMKEKKPHDKSFSLEKDKCIAALFKKQEKLIVMTLQVKTPQEAYRSQFRYEKFTLYSSDGSWSDLQLHSDPIAFHDARAIIPIEGGNIILTGETIVYSKKDDCLCADKGSLTQPDGTMFSTFGKIRVPVTQPMKFKID